MSDGRGKSDCCVVPEKLPNKAAGAIPAAAEVVEGRRQAKGNAFAARMSRRSMRSYDMGNALEGIRQTARGNKGARFTGLLHHIYAVERLEAAYYALRRDAALTSAKRMRAKLHAVKFELRRRMHRPIPEQGQYLRAVVTGHARYFGVPCNGSRLRTFRYQIARLWHRTLRRRSQCSDLPWRRMARLNAHWLPSLHICHPYPSQRLIVATRGKSRVR
jgi:hypothetical protein